MHPLDFVTVAFATMAAVALGLRGNMLKPEARAWTSSRTASLSILTMSIFMGGMAIDVHNRGDATPREAAFTAMMAITSVFMLLHLMTQRREETPEQRP